MRVANLYVRSLFAREQLSKDEETEARKLWPSLRTNFARQMFQQVLQKFMRAPESK